MAATGTYSGNAGGLTNLNATNIVGSVSANIVGIPIFNGSGITNLNANNISGGTFTGNGGGLTNLLTQTVNVTAMGTNGVNITSIWKFSPYGWFWSNHYAYGVTNSSTGTTLASVAIPGGIIGSNTFLKVWLALSSPQPSNGGTFSLNYGSVSLIGAGLYPSSSCEYQESVRLLRSRGTNAFCCLSDRNNHQVVTV